MMDGPKRLSELDMGELGKSLAVAKSQLPSVERLSRIAEGLTRAGAAVPAPSGDTPPLLEVAAAGTPKSEPLGLLAKLGVGTIGVGAIALGAALATRTTDAPSPTASSSPPSVVAPSAVVSAPQVPNAPSEGRTPPARPPADRAPRDVAPLPAPTVGAPPAADPASSPAPVAATSPRPERSAAAPKAHPGALEREQAVRGSPGAGTLDLETPPESEVELLKRARATAIGDPAQALAITRRHRAEFPNGVYAQERDFIAISALLKLGRRSEAEARAAAFRRRYPRSAYLVQIERMLGTQ